MSFTLIYDKIDLSLSVFPPRIPFEFPIVVDAYFAKKNQTLEASGTPAGSHLYTFESNNPITDENRARIAGIILGRVNEAQKPNNKYTTLDSVIGILTSSYYKAGTVVNVPLLEYKEKVSFEKINSASIGQEVYIKVDTMNFPQGKINITVKHGKENVFGAVDTPMELIHQGQLKTIIPAQVGVHNPNTCIYQEDLLDSAIVKIKLDHNQKVIMDSWRDSIKDAPDKKAYLYLNVEADSSNAPYNVNRIAYYGTQGIVSSPDTKVKNWLDVDGEWFELKAGCYCDRDLTVEEVKKLINKTTLFAHPKCPLPQSIKNYQEFTKQLNAVFKKYEINTCLRIAHFIAQIEAESDHFATTVEYADGWDYDHTTHKDRHDKYKLYLSNKSKYPKYAQYKRNYNRYKECLMHGHNVKGYGPKYKGKGLIQLTWKDTYAKYFTYLGKKDLISSPEEVAEDIFYSFDSAGWYWNYGSAWKNMNPKADNDDLIAVSIGINGGLNAYDHRKKNLKRMLKLMKVNEECTTLNLDQIGVYKLETSSIRNTKYGRNHKTDIQAFDD